MIELPQPDSIHNCGQVMFDDSGLLWVSTGDGGPGGDPSENGQNKDTLLGKVLRIDVSGATGYTIPPSNPFVGAPGADEIWAYGFRNPWRFSIDDETGEVWLGDVGQSAWEEVDRVNVAGGNYGWDCYEGNTVFEFTGCSGGTYQFTRVVYSHSDGCAVMGGWVYHGSLYPELAGWYVYADFCLGRIWAVNTASSTSPAVILIDSSVPITSIAQLPSGELAFVSKDDGVFLLTRD